MCQDGNILHRRVTNNMNLNLKRRRGTNANKKEEKEHTGYVLTRRVVSFHNRPNDAWVIYNGSVYDVTLFLESHPGGSDIVIDRLGSDVSQVMHGREGGSHEHSSYAFKVLEKYKIGELSETKKRDSVDGNSIVVDDNEDDDVGKVNWNEPILHQVGLLGEKYHKWIHSFPTTDHTVKMFTNDTIESLTKCAWYVPLLFWIPVIFIECIHYLHLMGGYQQLNALTIFMFGLCGGLCWLLFEYSLHRWIFHWRSTSYWGNIIHFLIHGHHHITPMDFDRLVFPPVPALLLGWPFWIGAPQLMGTEAGYPWLIGFVIGYLVYDMTHFWIHHGIPSNAMLKQQKRRHVHHHYFQPDVNFGISNPLFDYVFGTIKEPAQ